MSTQTQIPEDIMFDDLATLYKYTGMKRTAVYSAIKDRGFPEPVQVGVRAVRWKRSDVLNWLNSQPRGLRPTNVELARGDK